MTWVSPILVYEDSLLALFVDQSCITAAVQTGFGQDGKYGVALYSHFKSSEYPCKVRLERGLASMTAEQQREFQSKDAAEYQRECKLMGYSMRWVDVDTRAKRLIVTRHYILDLKGFHAFAEKGDKDWAQFSDIEKENGSRPFLQAIQHTTRLVEKELEYFNYRYHHE
jgi:hypothetical protein